MISRLNEMICTASRSTPDGGASPEASCSQFNHSQQSPHPRVLVRPTRHDAS